MARRPPPSAVAALGLLVALVVPLLGACDPPAGTADRDPTARQILPFREDSTSISRYSVDGKAIFLQTERGMTASGNMKVRDISLVDLATRSRTPVASSVLNFYEDGSTSDPPALVTVSEAGGSLGYVATVSYPGGAKPPFQIDRLASPSCCDWLSWPWGLRRYDTDFIHTRFWVGPFEGLMPVDAALQVSTWRRDATANAFLVTGTTDTTAPVTFGVWSVGLDGSAPVPIFGPTLGPVVAVDPTEDTTTLTSTSLTDGTIDLQECWSPGQWSTNADFAIEGTRCYAVYQRLVGKTPRLFFRDYTETTERLLPGAFPSNVTVTPWNARWLTWWAQSRSGAGTYSLFVHDLETQETHQCETGVPGVVLWQTRAPGAVILSGPSATTEIRSWDLSSPTCPVLATAQQPAVILSPDGKRWAWLETDANTGSKITVADGDLSNQRLLAEGTYFQQIGFLDDRRMLIWRTGLDGFGYSWLDTTLASPVEHALAEQVFFISSRLDDHQILVGHRFSDQDENGDLSLIDMDTGAERLLSHGVSAATLRFEDSTDGGLTHLLDVSFLVRGRYASEQDGLWLAKIPLVIPKNE